MSHIRRACGSEVFSFSEENFYNCQVRYIKGTAKMKKWTLRIFPLSPTLEKAKIDPGRHYQGCFQLCHQGAAETWKGVCTPEPATAGGNTTFIQTPGFPPRDADSVGLQWVPGTGIFNSSQVTLMCSQD